MTSSMNRNTVRECHAETTFPQHRRSMISSSQSISRGDVAYVVHDCGPPLHGREISRANAELLVAMGAHAQVAMGVHQRATNDIERRARPPGRSRLRFFGRTLRLLGGSRRGDTRTDRARVERAACRCVKERR